MSTRGFWTRPIWPSRAAEPAREFPTADPPWWRGSRRRKALWIGLIVALATPILLAVGGYFYLGVYANRALDEAVAEADQLDPGWRLEEIEAKRQADEIPVEDDAAVRVASAFANLPSDWQSTNPEVRAFVGPFRGMNLEEAIEKTPPNVLLGADAAAGLNDELHELSDALTEARQLADLNRGRYQVDYQELVIETLLPHTQNSRSVARLLRLDALHRVQVNDPDGALDDCRAIVGVSRSIGDEPFAISQLVRMSEDSMAIGTMERVLARGEASDSALAKLQDRLASETDVPFTLIGFRGDRAALFDMIGKIADERLSIKALSDGDSTPEGRSRTLLPHARAYFRYNQALSLGFMTRAVEIAKLPLAEQRTHWKAWDELTKRPADGWKIHFGAITYLTLPAPSAFHVAHVRIVGMLNVARVMVAMERFRLAKGRWPESVAEIPKTILPEAPLDPFSGRPVRINRVPDGWAVYCVGDDGEDNGGNLDPKFRPGRKGTDWGYRLWDVASRRLPPPPSDELPAQVFQDEPTPDRQPQMDPNL